MLQYIARRLVQMVPVVFVMSVVIFAIARLLPGDPVVTILGEQATPEQRQRVRQELRLDEPLPMQYGYWVVQVMQGDFGRSLRSSEQVSSMIRDRAPVTLELTLFSMILAVIIGVPSGIVAATRRDSWLDFVSRFIAMFGVAIPFFWMGLLLILLFALVLRWLPPSGYVDFLRDPVMNLKLMILPSITVGTSMAAIIMRQTRASMLQVLSEDYLRTARAKGLPNVQVLYRHALRNALITIVTIIGLQVGVLLGGAVVTETVFAMPGIGRMVVNAIFQRDYPVVQGGVLFIVANVLLVNLIVDLIYVYLDPRIKLS
jgi:peptide/nickel transport system permease protein